MVHAHDHARTLEDALRAAPWIALLLALAGCGQAGGGDVPAATDIGSTEVKGQSGDASTRRSSNRADIDPASDGSAQDAADHDGQDDGADLETVSTYCSLTATTGAPGACVQAKPNPNPACTLAKCPLDTTCMGGGRCRPTGVVVVEDATFGQMHPALAARPDGAYALAFTAHPTASGAGAFDPDPAKSRLRFKVAKPGSRLPVSSLEVAPEQARLQRYPTVLPVDDHWLVGWAGLDVQGGERGVYVRLVAADGSSVVKPITALSGSGHNLASGGDSNSAGPLLTHDTDGVRILAAWQGGPSSKVFSIRARALNRNGGPAGSEHVLSEPGEQATSPGLAAVPGGGLVAWQSQSAPKKGDVRVVVRRIDGWAKPVGPASPLTVNPPPWHGVPSLAPLAGGSWVLVYAVSQIKTATAPYDVRLRGFCAGVPGSVLASVGGGADHLLGSNGAGTNRRRPEVGLVSPDRVAVVWHDTSKSGGVRLRAWRPADDAIDCSATDVSGPPAAKESGYRTFATLASFGDGHVIVGWVSSWTDGPDDKKPKPRISLRFVQP